MKNIAGFHLLLAATFFSTSFTALPVCADIGRVYHPYVETLEREIELRITQSHDELDDHTNLYNIGYGQAINDKLFIEAYAIASESDISGADIEAFELEGIYQLTEKGSQALDYGLLIELERENENNITEIGGTILLEKEFGVTSLTTNLGLTYEFGSGIDNEYDRSARMQWRYRLRPTLEPALELFMDEYDKSAGPALMGAQRLAHRQKLKWELGLLFALEKETPDTMLRAVLEYEF